MTITLPKGYKADMARLKKAGFTHIKIELEADMNRPDDGPDREYCSECDGGWRNCDNGCDDGRLHDGPEPECYLYTGPDGETITGWYFDRPGDGWSRQQNPEWEAWNETTTACECAGDSVPCDNCDGSGYLESDSDGFADEDYCHDWILGELTPETRAALTYSKFYNDGSVDSELTFTMPIDQAHLAVEVMEAFRALGDEIGNGFETTNAGMHLSLLTSGTYPTRRPLNEAGITNFKLQVAKLLPALYAAATHNGTTRSLDYRRPQIAARDKYSAIFTHDDTCLEYRLFDTCYDQPEALLEKYRIMAATIKYYANPNAKVTLKASEFYLNLSADRYSSGTFADSIADLDDYRALTETVRLVRPHGVSMKEFLAKRGLDTIDLKGLTAKRRRDLALARERLRERYPSYRLQQMGRYYYNLGEWLRDHSYPTMAEAVAAYHQTGYGSLPPVSLTQYLKENTTTTTTRKSGYRLTLA
jgi:hypothetical protein